MFVIISIVVSIRAQNCKVGQGWATEFVQGFCVKLLAPYPYAKVISSLAGLMELIVIGMLLASPPTSHGK